MHLSWKKNLYKYLIFNITNFYFFLFEKKCEFIRIEVRIGDIIQSWDLFQSYQLLRASFHNKF